MPNLWGLDFVLWQLGWVLVQLYSQLFQHTKTNIQFLLQLLKHFLPLRLPISGIIVSEQDFTYECGVGTTKI